MALSYFDLWAKTNPFKALWQHMLDSGFVAQALLTQTSYHGTLKRIAGWLGCDEKEAVVFICYVVALHDIGKCHPVFQGKRPETEAVLRREGLLQSEPMENRFRHEKYSAIVAKRLLHKRTASAKTRRLIPSIAGLHHQGKSGRTISIYEKPELFEALQSELEAICYTCFPFPETVKLDGCGHVDALCNLLCAITVLSDWIASSKLSESFASADVDPRVYTELAWERAAAAVRGCGFGQYRGLSPMRDYAALGDELRAPRPMQRTVDMISNERVRLLIIEAPMGEGKTEAALLAASRMAAGERGMFFALPTAATSNLMYARLSQLFGGTDAGGLRLLHASAWLAQQPGISFEPHADTAEASAWLAPLRRGLLEQNAVGTVDQAMLSALRVRYGALRLLGLSGKALIIDEIHAYDTYMSTIIERLLCWCAALEVPVILLSATLPCKRREALIAAYTGKEFRSQNTAYPLVTYSLNGIVHEEAAGEAHMRRSLRIERAPAMGDVPAIAGMVFERVRDGGCLCVIVNTVDMAQKVYRAVAESVDSDTWTGLLHGRFPAGGRDKIERECNARFGKHGKRPKKAILVATQIVEQSCDYSFDYMISELAPVDLLLQRSGRLLRHENVGLWGKIPPRLTVLVPRGKDFGPSQYVYYPYLLQKTLSYLEDIDAIMIPDGIRSAVEAVYGAEPDDCEMELWMKCEFQEELQCAQASSVLLCAPEPESFGLYESDMPLSPDDEASALRAQTRLAEPSRRVLLIPREQMPSTAEMKDMPLERVQALYRLGLNLRDVQLIDSAADGYDPPVIGTGRLQGCVLFPMVHGGYEGRRGANQIRYILDERLGLIIEGRE